MTLLSPKMAIQDGPDQDFQVPGLWDQTAVTQEMFGAWTSACNAWGDYLSRLAAAPDPLGAFDAGAQLLAESVQIFSRATAARLRDGGLSTPLLNDA